ncbi:MAG: hypothetical protein Q4P15_03475 [Propionibacteriaceae bacterium]|nr:hypothetical protein [Propionibacteriaceae bacterium]
MRRHITVPVLSLAAALFLAGCGSTAADPAPTQPAQPPTSQETTAASQETTTSDSKEAEEAYQSEAAESADDMVENLEKQQNAEGGGRATFTAGDTTWEFDSVLCAFGEEAIGQEGAEFVLSSVKDGVQLYLSIDSYGHSMSLEDVKDFDNPSVSLSQADSSVDFFNLTGNSVSGEAILLDFTVEPPSEIPATVEATCP